MKTRLLFSFLFLMSFTSFSQQTRSCGGYVFPNGSSKEDMEEVEKLLQKDINETRFYKSSWDTITIPVVFHIMHLGEAVGTGNNISEAQILDGLKQLNEGFRNTNNQGIDLNVNFELAKLDPNCKKTTAINRVNCSTVTNYSSKGLISAVSGNTVVELASKSTWENKKFLNIWLVNKILGDNNASIGGVAIYPSPFPSQEDGVYVINSAWGSIGTAASYSNKGTTGIHEVGHWLNLYHTFEGDNGGNSCPSSSGNSCGIGKGDCCADTDIHKRASLNCPSASSLNTCSGNNYGSLVNNYMNYIGQDCANRFTQNQAERMRSVLNVVRGLLKSSYGLLEAGYSLQDSTVNIGDSIACINKSVNSTAWVWEVSGPENFSSTNEEFKFKPTQSGLYDIKLISTNGSCNDTLVTQRNITVIDGSNSIASFDFVKNNLKVYPNPTKGIVNFDFINKNQYSTHQVFVRTLNGQLVERLLIEGNRASIKLSLPNGVYVLEINSGGTSYNKRLIVN